MKTQTSSSAKKGWKSWLIGCAVALSLYIMWSNTARSDNLPGLSIQLVSSNQLQLVVTNGAATNSYEIYRRFALDDPYPWALHVIGTNGQTNFTAAMGIESQGFYQARVGTDSDADGVPNWKDADPYNASLGVLTIVIDSPANGANLQ